MELRNIGASSLRIARIVFGGNSLGWTVDQKRAFELLDTFVDRGFNCVDTADMYPSFIPGLAPGGSEEIIGKWFAQGGGRRDRVVIFTKVGLEMGPDQKGLSAAYIARAAEASLRRLQTDHIDLYYSHYDDPATPVDETLAAYDKLVRAGKVRYIGASNYSPARLTESLDASKAGKLPAYQCLQTLYNLYERDAYEGPLEQVCRQRNLAVFPYFALASGFLTGKYRSKDDLKTHKRGMFVEPYFTERGERILAELRAVATATNHTMGQIALAWLLSRPTVVAPVASATSRDQLNQMLAAVDVRLNSDQLKRLDTASRA